MAVGLSVLLQPGVAGAQSAEIPALSLDWSAATDCPDRAGVLARVHTLLGPASPAFEPIAATGIISSVPSGFALSLETAQHGQAHRRTLTAPTCEELSDAGALILALAVDPTLVVAPPARTDTSTQEAESSLESRPVVPDPPPLPTPSPEPSFRSPAALAPRREASEPGRPFELRFAASVLGDVGSLPRVAAGMALALEVGWNPFRFDAIASLLPPVRKTIAESPARGGDVMLLAGGLRACVLPFAAELHLGGCVGAESGFLDAESFGASAYNDGAMSGWLAVRAGLTARAPLTSGLALAVDLDALVPATRPTFVVERVGPVYQPAAVGFRLALGLEAIFFRRNP